MIRHYELGLVINPDLSDEQIDAQMLRVGQSIETRGGQITHLDRWGRRRMSYPIQHHRDGYYAFIDMQMDSAAVREVERQLLVQENIMRHLLTMIDPRALTERARRREMEAARAAQAQQRAAEAAGRAAEPAPPAPTEVAQPAAEAAPPPAEETPAVAAVPPADVAPPPAEAAPESPTAESDAAVTPAPDETTPVE
jgi:small subunit ribosomal protein S6